MYSLSIGEISVWISQIKDWQKPKGKCSNFRFSERSKKAVDCRSTSAEFLQFVESVQDYDLVVRIRFVMLWYNMTKLRA